MAKHAIQLLQNRCTGWKVRVQIPGEELEKPKCRVSRNTRFFTVNVSWRRPLAPAHLFLHARRKES